MTTVAVERAACLAVGSPGYGWASAVEEQALEVDGPDAKEPQQHLHEA